jgi:hypothetical protein
MAHFAIVDSESGPEGSLPAFLASRARSASRAHLALDVADGALVAGVALFGRQAGWLTFLLLCAAVCLAAFGTWGLADRALGGRAAADGGVRAPALRVLLPALRALAAAAGGLAGAALLFGALAIALGTWIS